MQLKRVFGIGLAAACLALLGSCGSGSPGNPGQNDEDVVSLTIPAAGGTIETDLGITVVAPAGAVTADTPITLSPRAPADSGALGLGAFPSAVECGPSGTTFAQAIEIRIPVDEAPASADCALFSREGTGGTWTQLDQDGRYDAAGKYLSLKTTHFSTIAYSKIAAPGIRVFADEFAAAGDHVTALAKLRELLLGDGGIMGVKQKVGDDTYEVCGVDIDVQYKYSSAENQHVGDLTGKRTGDTTILQYYRDDSTFAPDMTIISDTKVILYWKKVTTERYLVTYDFAGTGGQYITLNGYSSRMYFTVEVPAEESAAVDMEKQGEDIVFDAHFDQAGPSSIETEVDNNKYTDPDCPSTGDLVVLIGGSTAPGSCGVALIADDPESFLTALAWGYDEEEGYYRVPALDLEMWMIGGDGDGYEPDGSLSVVLRDGYSGTGYATMIGVFGVAGLGYSVNVRKLP